MIALTSRAIRSASADYRRITRVFDRLGHYWNALVDGIAEGREMAHAAKRRYPFVDW